MFYDLKDMKMGLQTRRMMPMVCTLVTSFILSSQLFAQDAAPVSAADSDAAAGVVAQGEVIRRQELVFRATQAIAVAEKAEANGDNAQAAERYQFALDNLSESPSTHAAIERARTGIVRVSLLQYQEAKKKNDTAGAIKALETAAKYDPNNGAVKDRLAKLKANQAEPQKGTILGNPAVTSSFVDDVH